MINCLHGQMIKVIDYILTLLNQDHKFITALHEGLCRETLILTTFWKCSDRGSNYNRNRISQGFHMLR